MTVRTEMNLETRRFTVSVLDDDHEIATSWPRHDVPAALDACLQALALLELVPVDVVFALKRMRAGFPSKDPS